MLASDMTSAQFPDAFSAPIMAILEATLNQIEARALAYYRKAVSGRA